MRKIDVSGMIAIGNGEPCPFCANEGDRLVEDIFISDVDNDIVEHMMNEHPSELNKELFKDPPPKQWLEQPFQLLIAKIAARLRIIEEDERITHETFEETMHGIYADMKEFFQSESD
jgi:hypothetical protein